MTDLSKDFIERCREEYRKLTREEGADYFRAEEAFKRTAREVLLSTGGPPNKGAGTHEPERNSYHEIGRAIDARFQDWVRRELRALSGPNSAHRAAALKLAEIEYRFAEVFETATFHNRVQRILDRLRYLLTLCQGRNYPNILFWKDMLVSTLGRLDGLAKAGPEKDTRFEADLHRFWGAVTEMSAPAPADALPCLDIVARLGGRLDFVDGLRVLADSPQLIHDLAARYAIAPKARPGAQPSHPGRALPLIKIGPVRAVTGCVLHIYGVQSVVREFMQDPSSYEKNIRVAIGFLGSRDLLGDCSILIAIIDTLLGRTDVPYEGLMSREGYSPFVLYDHGPMHRYGRSQARCGSVRTMLDASNRFIESAKSYFMALKMHSVDALVHPLDEIRESARYLATVDVDR